MTDPYGYYDNRKTSPQPAAYPQQDIWYNGEATSRQSPIPNGNGSNQNTDFYTGACGMDGASTNASSNQYYNNYYAQQPNMFIPTAPAQPAAKAFDDDFENEPPLLEELGINFDHIRLKTLAVLNPMGNASTDVIADQDLAGPLVFCLLFGASLLLHGKVQFGYIYGIGLIGCTGMYALLNLMAAEQRSISFTNTASVLGYCLLPMSLLSLLAAVLSLQGIVGYAIVTLAVLWSGISSSKLFSIALSMNGQRLLVAYPCTLLYSVFALLAIF